MKILIGIVVASLMFANIGFAEMRLIEDGKISGSYTNYFMATICVDGYKFVSLRPKSSAGPAVSMVQFYEAGNNQSPIPARC